MKEMMKVLGNKILLIGDLHYGEHSDSETFNKQVNEFIDWVCNTVKPKYGVETAIQLGDYFHHRNKVNVRTLNYGVDGARKLSEAFGKENVGIIVGNHDMFYLSDVGVNSLRSIEELVTVIDETGMIGDKTLITPWVTGQEAWEKLVVEAADPSIEYVLGHFEFSGFKLNAGYEIETPYTHRAFKNKKRVVTGHYHTPQTKDNVQYTGTPYPITMTEANQDHGVWILDLETDELEFVVYDKVKVISIDFDELTDELIEGLDASNTSLRVEFPGDIDPIVMEETMKKLGEKNFQVLRSKHTPIIEQQILDSEVDVEEHENIDEVVVRFIEKMDAGETGIDSKLLADIYLEAISRGDE